MSANPALPRDDRNRLHNASCETAENIALTTFWTTNPAVYTTESQLRMLATAMADEATRYFTPASRGMLADIYRQGMSAAAQQVMRDVLDH